jgi:peptide/nickel transport system permease protein
LIRRVGGARLSLVLGLTLLAGVAAACVVVPLVWPYAPDRLVTLPNQAPSWSHPFGTDAVGRDVFVRTFAGGRIDLIVVAIVQCVSLAIGTTYGILSGSTRRRWIDTTLMRIVDALIAFPFTILILALFVVIGPDKTIGPIPAGLPATVIALLIGGWTYYARLARSQTLALRDRDFIAAANILGYSRPRIVVRHFAPSVIRVNAAYAVGDSIVVVVVLASLSFLGAGVQQPTPEWGNIMFEGRALLQSAWWITVAPGALLLLTGLALSLVADRLLAAERSWA